ncbi:hypothetical protein M2459_002802 [Parabacteroides sp. PF5-5]|uniref:RagB/SusD family nutrient uptake outer membrane protein n=1 Tax=unclassified Parabacteroides TaxID=2649774 RepID=UPI0024739F7D|nr:MULTISPECIES: RagB/SusD family nutrient uptake outer membrane protein [unclassified Parabacteroides]MDH6306054.1 hypothetical protein [Parabacteroides sp. PH5-39]MDH6317048.1 hypothetical protein [Parabacteroides sp. PF5-13]MDH6320801.1 hypothetical protein [Parabacteroides sp. PH5-13]MDH6324497.1 hypothetical protein [Parabacteroides sp. PH5-8]MDH6328233.1 hypothetical protein [Parabacteroides sp. PH5-41]
MKKIIYIRNIILSLLTVIAFSCQDLDENPAGTLAAESFFTTTADLDAAVTAVYYQLVADTWGGFGHTNIWTTMFGADDLTTAGDRADYIAFDRFAVTNLNAPMKSCAWTRSYGVVREASSVINNYHRVEGGSEGFILERAAEAHFLRAWAYFWLVRTFGEIPLVTSTEIDYNLPLSPVSDIYALIVEDLEFAIKHLSTERDTYIGRPSAWSAKGLLAQVYLTMAGWPLKDESKYALAASLAKDVIDNGPYRLLDNYKDLWLDSSDNNDEVVWSIQFCTMKDCGLAVRCTFIGLNTQPSEERGWDQVFCEVGFYNRFPEGPRKDATFWTNFEVRETSGDRDITGYVHFSESKQKHPFLAKYRDGYVPGEASWNGDSDHMGGRDVNYLRFAEILLIYAEAQCMADGAPNAQAYECINATRKRAGLDNLTPGLGKIAFRDAVIDERGWEFCGEYSRWFDLVRTQKVAEMNNYKDEVDFKPLNPIDESRYLAPIPYTEVLLNPNLQK